MTAKKTPPPRKSRVVRRVPIKRVKRVIATLMFVAISTGEPKFEHLAVQVANERRLGNWFIKMEPVWREAAKLLRTSFN